MTPDEREVCREERNERDGRRKKKKDKKPRGEAQSRSKETNEWKDCRLSKLFYNPRLSSYDYALAEFRAS